jgi:hypothetical protein
LNHRGVKGEVKNAYRAYKYLYYTVLDAICCYLFLQELNLENLEDSIPLPDHFDQYADADKISWINDICERIIQKYFFEGSPDIMSTLRDCVTDKSHPDNYWVSNFNEGRVKCHHCEKTYAYVGSLKAHEEKMHGVTVSKKQRKEKKKSKDELNGYIMLLFKLSLLHKNLDDAVDMADGVRSIRSAKYELPIYNFTNKTKYAIGSIHLVAMTEGLLNEELKVRLTANRFINLQGGKNNNLALDEYVELLNRDSKFACSGFQTKESIIAHSKEFPHIINSTKHFDDICDISGRKGFHTLPSYLEDVKKVFKELSEINPFSVVDGRKLKCETLKSDPNIYDECFSGLSTLIVRHKPVVAYHRLRNKHI